MLKVNAKTGEIFLYGVVGGQDYGGDFGESDVVDALDQLGGKRAKVRISSVGGLADAGIGIYNALKRYDGGVDTYNDSLAASAGSLIAMAGENRYTATGSRWMIHRAMGGVVGNHTDIKKYLAQLESYDQSVVQIYQSAFSIDTDKLEAMLDAETWFTSDQAIEIGLATALDGQTKAKPAVAAWMKNPPAEMIAACAGQQIVSMRPKINTAFKFGSRA